MLLLYAVSWNCLNLRRCYLGDEVQNNNRKLWLLTIVAAIFAVSMIFQNCGQVKFNSATDNSKVQGGPCETCNSQSFQQPASTITNKVDILLVVHDTASF